jgi:hypothetical protein
VYVRLIVGLKLWMCADVVVAFRRPGNTAGAYPGPDWGGLQVFNLPPVRDADGADHRSSTWRSASR